MTIQSTDALFPPFAVPEDLRLRAQEKGWPDDLVQRMVNLRFPRGRIEWYLDHEQPGLAELQMFMGLEEQMTFGTLRGRLATVGDNGALVELFANSPEDIGEWEVTVERGPDALAQFRIQENPYLKVVEDRGLLLACLAFSWRNTLVAGTRLTADCPMAWRVRREFRGENLSRAVRMVPAAIGPPGYNGEYWYIRSQNFTVVGVIDAHNPAILAAAQKRTGEVPGIPVTVLSYPGQESGLDDAVRQARREDAPVCAALINKTHAGLDLFRPYSAEFLESKLDEWGWGRKPEGRVPVYSWNDYYVLEEEGRIVACGGLWDRGKNVRERWRRRDTGEESVISSTALLDFGYAAGHEEAMARLIRHFAVRTRELGRDHLLAPLDQLPGLAARLEDLQPAGETRGFNWRTFGPGGQTPVPDPLITRPYTDLAYW